MRELLVKDQLLLSPLEKGIPGLAVVSFRGNGLSKPSPIIQQREKRTLEIDCLAL